VRFVDGYLRNKYLERTMKMLKLLFKDILNSLLVATMMLGPLNVWAGDDDDDDVQTTDINVDGFAQVIGAGGQIFDQAMQARQQAMQAQMVQQQLMQYDAQYLSENLNSKSGAPAVDPVFGLCRMPVTHLESPNWCPAELPPTNASEAMLLEAQMQKASSNAEYYKNFLMNEGEGKSTQATASGLKCMENLAQKAVSDVKRFKKMLKDQVDYISKMDEMFKREASKMYDQMKDVQAEITGEGLTASQTRKLARDLQDANCKSAYTTDQIKDALKGGGLTNMESEISPKKAMAQELIDGRAANEQIFREQVGELSRYYDKNGPAGLAQAMTEKPIFSTENTFGSIQTHMTNFNETASDMQTELQTINSYLGNAKVRTRTQLEFGKDFISDAEVAIKDADYYESQWYESCLRKTVSSASNGKYGYDTLYNNIEQPGAGTQYASGKGEFKNLLENILSSDLNLDEKIEQIKGIEKDHQKRGIKIRLMDKPGGTKVSKYLTGIKNSTCRRQYSTKAGGEMSPKDYIANATKRLDTLRSSYTSIGTQFRDDLLSDVLNCTGTVNSSKNYNSTSCADANIQPSSANFCFKHSDQCASNIKACSNKVTGYIEEREESKVNMAKIYNEAFDQLFIDRDRELERLKATYGMINTQLRFSIKSTKLRNDTAFSEELSEELPVGLIIKQPEVDKDKDLGDLKIAGGGDPAKFDWLNKDTIASNWVEIEKGFDAQIALIETKVTDEMTELNSVYEGNISQWDEIAEQCNGLLSKFEGDEKMRVAQDSNCQQIQYGMCQKAIAGFSPGCEEVAESLSTDLAAITNLEGNTGMGCGNPATSAWISKFGAYCQGAYGEADETDVNLRIESPEDINGDDFVSFCKMGHYDSMTKDALDILAGHLDGKVDKDELSTYLSGGNNDLEDDLLDKDNLGDTDVLAYAITIHEMNKKVGSGNDKASQVKLICNDFEDEAQGASSKVVFNPNGGESAGVEQELDPVGDAFNNLRTPAGVSNTHLADDIVKAYSRHNQILNEVKRGSLASSFSMGEIGLPTECGRTNTGILTESLVDDLDFSGLRSGSLTESTDDSN
jgi:hypothetical protein